ncbi:hypothetical protein H6F88_17620 [Oculatella sp. FACHB-28]|uniref:hypothetical protein n=1 Tax=Oculatella sp. FACHB-28 TaxID=2692845 RepID=UPI0016851D06|nr:hypothetical protein [Oculatella sp. FACHB-28]MBD2057816.1 hypothetical protein [Oculatella sp. FACHB-28]
MDTLPSLSLLGTLTISVALTGIVFVVLVLRDRSSVYLYLSSPSPSVTDCHSQGSPRSDPSNHIRTAIEQGVDYLEALPAYTEDICP